MEPTVAAFDVDGTLTVRDCVLPYLWKVGGARGALRALFSSPVLLLRSVARRDRDALKAHFVRSFLRGVPVETAERAGEEFAARVASGWMRGDVASRLRAHQDAGDVVVLVSASLSPYLEPLGELLEVDAVMCTRLESVDGVLTGGLLGPNCRAAEKARRLEEWAASSGLSGDAWLGHAYGDSSGDTEMLQSAVVGTDVSRRGWEQ